MLRISTAATLAALLTSTSAFALEGKALFEKIVDGSEAKFTYGAIEETASDGVRLTDVKVTDGPNTVTMGVLTLEGLSEDGDRVRLARSTSENTVYTFPLPPEQAAKNPDGKVSFRFASGVSSDAIGPAEAMFSLTPEALKGVAGRLDVGAYELSDVSADIDGDGTFETSMATVSLSDLSTPLDFRYDAESLKREGSAPEPLTLGSFTIDGTKVDYEGGAFTLDKVSVEGIEVPATIDAPVGAFAKTYKTLSMGPMKAEAGDQTLFSIGAIKANISDDSGTIRSASQVEDIMVNLRAIAGPGGEANISALGYDTVTGRAEGRGSYAPEAGVIEVEEALFDFDQVAELAMSYKMSGYTAEFARQMNELSMQASQTGKPADPMAMMNLLTQLKIENVRIALKDDSIVNKALEFQAAQMKTKPEQLAQMAPMFVGMGMAQLGMPEFTSKVSAALGSFLADPGTLVVSAQPAQPVSVGDLMVAGQQAPKAVIEMLNVDVQATK